MEPIPETLDAIAELDAHLDDGTLFEKLKNQAVLAHDIAPDLAGFSIASVEHGITFTMVATDAEIAALDGVQYATSGPCIDVVAAGQGVITKSEDLFNEPRWHALALASAAAGVRSTLTFPIMNGDEVIGTVNLYGRSDDTFSGKHAALADVFGAWAPGAVMNADMSFSTRLRAEGAPAQLREDALIDAATGILAAHHKIPVEDARETLEQAAARAGLPLTALARTIIKHQDYDD
jgi:GAF domain-containing protein